MNKKEDSLLQFKPEFQKKIFERVISKYGSSLKSSHFLGIPPSSIRGYKNLYFNCVPEQIVKRLIGLKIIFQEEINLNLIKILSKSKQIKEKLDLGRKKRKDQIETWKKEIPLFKEILGNSFLDLEKWFLRYIKLINFGARKINYIKKKGKFIQISYTTHSNKEKKEFIQNFQRRIRLSKEFIYFFGLWCGDKAGGKRFGICNQNQEILNFTKYFLEKNKQKVEKILYISKSIKEPDIEYDKKFILNHDKKGWVLSVHSINGIFSTFFNYLKLNLADFLKNIKNKEIFFAGLFDAEGNISVYNQSFRWACKNEELIKIYSKYLKELSLFDKYDGSCLIAYNKKIFYKKIFPYLKHSKKINLTLFLCKGKGMLPEDYPNILRHIKFHPKKTAGDLAKALKKNKIYSELSVLNEFGFISYRGYPHCFEITSKGLSSLGE